MVTPIITLNLALLLIQASPKMNGKKLLLFYRGTGQKSPPIRMKSKKKNFIHFFILDSDIRYIKV